MLSKIENVVYKFLIFDHEFWLVLDISAYCLYRQVNIFTPECSRCLHIVYKGHQIWEQPVWNLGFI